MRAARGFTLIEVMVALAVLAIALGAIVQSITSNTSNASYLREKTLAHWVAMNKVAEIQVLRKFPDTGIERGTEEMANHDWQWQVKVVDSGVEKVRRLEVEVRRDREQKEPLAFLVAIIGEPLY